MNFWAASLFFTHALLQREQRDDTASVWVIFKIKIGKGEGNHRLLKVSQLFRRVFRIFRSSCAFQFFNQYRPLCVSSRRATRNNDWVNNSRSKADSLIPPEGELTSLKFYDGGRQTSAKIWHGHLQVEIYNSAEQWGRKSVGFLLFLVFSSR